SKSMVAQRGRISNSAAPGFCVGLITPASLAGGVEPISRAQHLAGPIAVRSTLRGRMQTNRLSKRLPLEHVNLHYLDYGGPGPHTLVCVHGGGANAHWFDFVGPALARDCRVLAVDLRGHGESSWAEPPVYTFEAHMQDLRALFHTERLTAPLLLGHSMGGIL